jgi:hypothetical protein
MNEVELIRNQLTGERQRAGAVVAAIAVDPAPARAFRQACVDYLASVLARFEERDQRIAELLRAGVPAADATRRALEEALAQPGRSRDTLERLAAAVAATGEQASRAARESWQEFARYFESRWCARRDRIDSLFAPHARVSDWRVVAGIDADSILDERQRYARVRAHLAGGATLPAA